MCKQLIAALICTLCLSNANAQANAPPKRPSGNAPQKAVSKTSLVRTELNRAYRFLRKGETEKARLAFERVLRFRPNHHAATVELGYLCVRQQQWPEAV